MATIEHSVQRELSERPARYQGSRFTGRVNEIIQTVEKAQTPQEIPTIKKLRGERNYFRIRIGDLQTRLENRRPVSDVGSDTQPQRHLSVLPVDPTPRQASAAITSQEASDRLRL